MSSWKVSSSVDFVNFGREVMVKSGERIWIGLTNFIAKSSHHSFDVSWSRVAINSLRINGPFSLDVPEIVPLGTKKELVFTLISPQRRRMTWKVCFHEFLVGVGAVRLRKVLHENHVLISFEEFPLVDGQSC